MKDLVNGRCGWCGTDELYVKYHDEEWGRLVTDDKTLFEFLILESAQAGLSWITILRKREGYRKAFCDFDAERVAQMGDEDVERLMRFDGIVKNRLKIKSTITNARLFLALQKEFGSFFNYTLSFFPDRKPIDNIVRSLSEIPPTSAESDAMSKDMKKRGFKFFGPLICYAHLQAAGFINDHLADCICRKKAAQMFAIKKATVSDRFLIRDLASRIWENTYGSILSKEQLDYMFEMMYAPDNILKQMTELGHQFFIITSNGTPSGYLSIEKTGENTYNFQKIYSLPELHGTGIGRFMIEEGIKHLKENEKGSFTIELFVNRHNPAIGFYKHMGFQEKGTRDHHVGNGFYMNDYIMQMPVER